MNAFTEWQYHSLGIFLTVPSKDFELLIKGFIILVKPWCEAEAFQIARKRRVRVHLGTHASQSGQHLNLIDVRFRLRGALQDLPRGLLGLPDARGRLQKPKGGVQDGDAHVAVQVLAPPLSEDHPHVRVARRGRQQPDDLLVEGDLERPAALPRQQGPQHPREALGPHQGQGAREGVGGDPRAVGGEELGLQQVVERAAHLVAPQHALQQALGQVDPEVPVGVQERHNVRVVRGGQQGPPGQRPHPLGHAPVGVERLAQPLVAQGKGEGGRQPARAPAGLQAEQRRVVEAAQEVAGLRAAAGLLLLGVLEGQQVPVFLQAGFPLRQVPLVLLFQGTLFRHRERDDLSLSGFGGSGGSPEGEAV
mmetsp:Transcript_48871/g.83994  ORF Transcript_48871/g.83994 Transcript_48871/m.83994 type:complete len:363 (-) Transcript_48871:329-1417(-)